MPHEKGTYLGGVRNRQSLMDRCRVDEDTEKCTGCWHWSLACQDGHPSVCVLMADGKRKKMRGRRAALYIGTGTEPPPGMVAMPIKACKSDDCVRPEHARAGTKTQAVQAAADRGDFDTLPRKLSAAKAARFRRTSPEQIAQLLAAAPAETNVALARQTGLSETWVSAIRRGKPAALAKQAIRAIGGLL